MAQIVFTAIRPRGMNIKAYQNAIDRALLTQRVAIRGHYSRVSLGFSSPVKYKEEGPHFTSGGERSVRVSTDDVRMVMLDRGTRFRWAVMTKNFRPKTRVRVLQSQRGIGRTVIRGKTAMTARHMSPRQGILPRFFSDEIIKREQAKFENRVVAAISAATKKTF